MLKKLNQRIHEFLGNTCLLKYTNCIERGCTEYHGNSPSQVAQFIGYRSQEDLRKELTKDQEQKCFCIHSDSFPFSDI